MKIKLQFKLLLDQGGTLVGERLTDGDVTVAVRLYDASCGPAFIKLGDAQKFNLDVRWSQALGEYEWFLMDEEAFAEFCSAPAREVA